jgi:hypothetical protein
MQVFAEYTAHPMLRESLNPFTAAQAILPGGVKDLADPEKEIFSVSPDYRS